MILFNKLVLEVEGSGGAEWLVACPIEREAGAGSAGAVPSVLHMASLLGTGRTQIAA